MPTILITGASGFLATASARHFYSNGWHVIGISRSSPSANNPIHSLYHKWISSPICQDVLLSLEQLPDVILHCSGCSSVSQSIHQPFLAFDSIVNSTSIILDFLRLYSPNTLFLYPSSAAVYGEKPNKPISE